MKSPELIYHVARFYGGVTLTAIEESRTRIIHAGESLKVRNHSPTGFNFGYGGSGPAQLALAILWDFFDGDEYPERLYQEFKWAFVANWQSGTAEITGKEIIEWVRKREAFVADREPRMSIEADGMTTAQRKML